MDFGAGERFVLGPSARWSTCSATSFQGTRTTGSVGEMTRRALMSSNPATPNPDAASDQPASGCYAASRAQPPW